MEVEVSSGGGAAVAVEVSSGSQIVRGRRGGSVGTGEPEGKLIARFQCPTRSVLFCLSLTLEAVS